MIAGAYAKDIERRWMGPDSLHGNLMTFAVTHAAGRIKKEL